MMVPMVFHMLVIKEKGYASKVRTSDQDRDPRRKDLWGEMGVVKSNTNERCLFHAFIPSSFIEHPPNAKHSLDFLRT